MSAISAQPHMPAYEDMIKSGMHFGRKKTIFHPNMQPYVYTVKESIYILDLIKTSEALIKAIDFMRDAVIAGKTILFVGITKQSGEGIKSTAEALGMPYVAERWLGGTFTNFKIIISRVKHLEQLEKEQMSGGFDKYTKKEKLLKEREIISLRQKYDGLRKLNKVPDIVFVSSLKESQLVVREAKISGVSIIGIVNTDSNPKQLDYPIPANDNSKRSVELILNAIKNGLMETVQNKQSAAAPEPEK
ncbi:MAG: 30S ribosomal protein S2 [Candidatus Yanofskybacteria bacterium RIFCSPLOWO2_01_FULL_49_25]|uniref:Small ribosomal subunit protein uS2 n=1 Tax=Candidatus Yanofskybacteria bacterium RIFCSPLOWO2_01_FULL_49_25 TaxID=1802701 RepID=A0A1F8GR41_9BACT|nr:MAG: 30S ribosomal protein S2 [Candidatus Yanofskybacteria bacterium RIFCSPLOWO2_01_FULL_49_25]